MQVATDLVSDWINCHYKTFLKLDGAAAKPSSFVSLQRERALEYQEEAIGRLVQQYDPRTIIRSPASLTEIVREPWCLALDVSCTSTLGPVVFAAMEITRLSSSNRQQALVPICFSRTETISSHDRLLAAVMGALLSQVQTCPVRLVKFIHGPTFRSAKVILTKSDGSARLFAEAQEVIAELEAFRQNADPPQFALNNHCSICEFSDSCHKLAEERDDLSLLRGLKPAEVTALKERGLFTVTQLAYTFRAKTVGRIDRKPKRHSQPLQAAAIRDKTIYVRLRPTIPSSSSRVFLDVEGIPERGSFYLIGLLVEELGKWTEHQLWADTPNDEKAIWHAFVSKMASLRDYIVFHFGPYEQTFVEKMSQRYGCEDLPEDFCSFMHDLHRSIRTNVFFPVYSNGLKPIGTLLGATWRGPVSSGLESIAWRYRWEREGRGELKADLLRYNLDDCCATRLITDFLSGVSSRAPGEHRSPDWVDTLPDSAQYTFGQSAFAIPELRRITKCAYFDYQQEKVFFRTDKNVRRSFRRRHQAPRKAHVNKRIECDNPSGCPKCGGEPMHRFQSSWHTKIVRDIKFSKGGVRRWIVEYATRRYECPTCQHTCYSPGFPTGGPKVGRALESWAVYQNVALRQSVEGAAQTINDLFGYAFSQNLVKRSRDRLARFYEETEIHILERLRSGVAICADEAKIEIKGGNGYVWTFSNAEEVVYRFSRSREATVLDEVLGPFDGVLVSDFYGAYDSVKCQQQKCLVHLIRDINDDLLKAPFDAELKAVAQRFTDVLKPIIDAIDHYGLKRRHLEKFVRTTEQFRKWLADQPFVSKPTRRYQKRIARYGERLFTFLSFDGVPWNNNLAENAVKLIVSRRRFFGASYSEKGMGDYLLFLSIFQTLRRKSGSFLRFLLAKETDIFKFLGD